MDKSIYNVGSTMKFFQEKVNVISNNLSNSATMGFKKDTIVSESFDKILLRNFKSQVSVFGNDDITKTSFMEEYTPGVYASEVITSYEKGNLEDTGRKSDIALATDSYMVVKTKKEDVYIGSATTKRDNEGYLIVPTLGRVQGESGDIQIESNDFTIDEVGRIYVDGEEVDKIKAVQFRDMKQIKKVGDVSFTTPKSNVQDDDEAMFQQGFLEGSNVNMTNEMVDLIEVSRRYQTVQQTIQMLDEIFGIAVNKIGRV
ncbi:hypothetical protein IMX26_00520 [Clostridium sp. 'deep sea']|uniref:flagellar hook-basal body protein n=1 Tax=Clostridium sp. 'deep sea' TaxID=2779445 RepID=UPI0018969947|nr:flagellar basal body rod C-terminal domain-containing protein [Clostridium sp. 'deep sea']QOR35359.1 hypothetical protein IMX26_00520 [Clostridium sp. 'deep sea']